MTIYVFETMSQGDAASFTAADSLTFSTVSATATQVSVAPYTNNQGGSLGNSGISLTYGGKNLVFSDGLASASQNTASNGGIEFRDGSYLIIGNNTANSGSSVPTGDNITVPSNEASNVVYGLGGSDRISGGDGNNYLYGGTDATPSSQSDSFFGGDSIFAGNGNNHIYGNALTTTQGQTDGNDVIIAGGGSNYINGNAGNDYIAVGFNASSDNEDGSSTPASTGNNRVFGGAGGDYIVVNGGGVNAVNGNVGDDYITAGNATGNNMLRGGASNDTIVAGHGQDVIMGDNGDDSLVAGTGGPDTSGTAVLYGHLTIMTGGAGADTFDFSGTSGQGNAGVLSSTTHTHSGVVVNGTAYYQTITDFTQGTDTIHLFNSSSTTTSGANPTTTTMTGTDIVTAQSGVTFTSVKAAETYAQQLLDNHTLSTSTSGSTTTTAAGEVAAIDVNGNTYLFYHAAGGETGANGIDSIVQLTGVSSSTLSQAGTGTHTFS